MRRFLPELDRNGWRLMAAKTFRGYAFGLNAVALGLYLAALQLPAQEIGFILAAALAGTLGLTAIIGIWGDRIGRRRLLVLGSALMLLSAIIPFVGANPVLLALIGLTGMVAVTSSESTGLQSVDQAALPQTVSARQRTSAFALYNLVAAAASALGALSVGPMISLGHAIGLEGASAYAPAFVAYALAGLASTVLTLGLDARVESGVPISPGFAIRRSRRTVALLSALFSLDALAGGFVVQSYLAFWFAERFGADPAAVGVLFAICNLLAALSFPVAAWLARRIGLIRTMVFTHIPANIFLIGTALAPTLPIAVVLMLARAALSSMDVPARASYVMAVVSPAERPAAAGVTAVPRSLAAAIGPAISGYLLTLTSFGWPLVICGALKIVYDLTLLGMFSKVKPPEER